MKVYIIAEDKTGKIYTFLVGAKSLRHGTNKAYRYLTREIDVMPKRIRATDCADLEDFKGKDYPRVTGA